MISTILSRIWINPNMISKECTDQVVGKLVTPMAAIEKRVKAEMKESIKENILTYQRRL